MFSLTSILNFVMDGLYDKTKGFNRDNKTLTPEQLHALKEEYYRRCGFYPDASFDDRIQRFHSVCCDTFGVDTITYRDMEKLINPLVDRTLRLHNEAMDILFRQDANLPVTKAEIESVPRKLQEV